MSVPADIARDIKKEDGWRLVISTLGAHDQGVDYIVFYNRLTGILKIFYHSDTRTPNNTAIWQISFNLDNSILNSSGDFSFANNSPEFVRNVQLSNISNTEAKGFGSGWNCFMSELNYDPANSGQHLNIDPYNLSTYVIKMSGSYKANTSGLVAAKIQTSQSSPFINKGAQESGKFVSDWVKDSEKGGKFIKSDKLRNALSGLASGGVTSLVRSGLSAIFGSFTRSYIPEYKYKSN